jgi:serine/threonine-protein kinase
MTTTTIPNGTLINNCYLVERVLGNGGFGRTYLVEDKNCFEEPCVLKEFAPSGMTSSLLPKCRELFEKEARLLKKLSHPQIPKFKAYFEDRGGLFLVQEYIDGQTYQSLLKQNKTFSEAEAIQLLRDLLPAIEYIHSQGIIHRDISPDNIIWSQQKDKPVLIDFGIAKNAVMTTVVQAAPDSNYSSAVPGSCVGKFWYSPIEQIQMGKCYESSDLYSLAVTAIVLLTGKPPNLLFDDRAREWKWRTYAKVSNKFAAILDKMLQDKHQNRYKSASEVLAELSKLPAMQASGNNSATSKASSVPKTVLSLEPRNGKYKLMAIAFGLLAAFLLLRELSPNTPVLCAVFDNCSEDREDKEERKSNEEVIYDEAVKEAQSAISNNPKNIDELHANRDRLQKAITKLETIPSDATIYQKAELAIEEYVKELNKMDVRLEVERNAEKQLARVEELAGEVTRQTNEAKDICDFHATLKPWKEVQQKLKEIPPNTFLAEEVQGLSSEYEGQVQQVNNRIQQERRRRPDLKRPDGFPDFC